MRGRPKETSIVVFKTRNTFRVYFLVLIGRKGSDLRDTKWPETVDIYPVDHDVTEEHFANCPACLLKISCIYIYIYMWCIYLCTDENRARFRLAPTGPANIVFLFFSMSLRRRNATGHWYEFRLRNRIILDVTSQILYCFFYRGYDENFVRKIIYFRLRRYCIR